MYKYMQNSTFEKYQKYKTKYINLKNQLGGGASLKIKVLIVVDVQTCFLSGTMGPGSDISNAYISKIKTFVEESKSKYDIIIFTKDNHPMNHNSFGIYHPHCIEEDGKYCNKNGRDKKIKELYEKSYMKTTTKSYDDHANVDKYNKTGKNLAANFENENEYKYDTKIQLKPEFLETTSTIDDINQLTIRENDRTITTVSKIEASTDEIFKTKPYIIRINKGELCNFDAYGAFAYHVSYKEEEKKLQEIDIIHNPKLLSKPINWKYLSTGLAEFLISKDYLHNKLTNIELDIDVCGLVTNICVVSTCITGCKVFKALDFDNYKFNILNEYCMNLLDYNITKRNAEKIIVDNCLTNKITISRSYDIHNFNPIEEYKYRNLHRE
jgi:nicotinamidase-related amidase